MKLTYSIYRSKNDELITIRNIGLKVENFEQLIRLEEMIHSVIRQDIGTIPEIQKFGTAYVGKIVWEAVEITDEDYTDVMGEEQFREFFKTVSEVPLLWSKSNKEEVSNATEQDTNKESKPKTRKSNRKSTGDKKDSK